MRIVTETGKPIAATMSELRRWDAVRSQRPHPTADSLDRTSDKDICQPELRVRERQELGWAATFLASPYGRFISGHTLVVDGANWLRRSMTSPTVVTVRNQLGRGPFEA